MSRPRKSNHASTPAKAAPAAQGPLTYAQLSERQQKGYALWERSQTHNGSAIVFSPEETLWVSQTDPDSIYRVSKIMRNDRGAKGMEYRCTCDDFKKRGEVDCKHIFAEKLRLEEVVVAKAGRKTGPVKQAVRGPARVRFAQDGRPLRTAQRQAIREMPVRIPDLTVSLKRAFDKRSSIVVPIRAQPYQGGKKSAPLSSKAMALIAKVASGRSASEMQSVYKNMIEDGTLLLRRVPAENTLSKWLNDERLTPILREFLRLTAESFREREVGAMIDSTKVSQLMTAHAKEVDYNGDKRPGANWVKAHTLVGVETMVVMGVEFSGTSGAGTHDGQFTERLVETGLKTFPLKFLLGDKAYLSEALPQWLWDHGIQAVIPIKMKTFRTGNYGPALTHLIEWFDRNGNRDFHDFYRLRSKVEGCFSLFKRMAGGGYCWSRGRKRKDNQPCTAWINELLCRFIFLNLRTTVTLETETGVQIDYLVPSRRFPAPDKPLLKQSA